MFLGEMSSKDGYSYLIILLFASIYFNDSAFTGKLFGVGLPIIQLLIKCKITSFEGEICDYCNE